ncbi:MAG: hypothetical protein AAF515_21880 [Pseudomonadota bacterium]
MHACRALQRRRQTADALASGLAVAVLLLFMTACSEPFVVLPGGQLPGKVAAPPALWGDVPETIDIESRPDDPYSVIVWAVGLGPDLYVATSGEGTNWTRHFDANPLMRARIDSTLYELSAVKIGDPTEMARVIAAYEAKYDTEPAAFSSGMIYRLDRR